MYYLSEPARSTRFSLENRRLDIASFSHLLSITHVKTLCERLLSLFMLVAATFLFEEPYCKFPITRGLTIRFKDFRQTEREGDSKANTD